MVVPSVDAINDMSFAWDETEEIDENMPSTCLFNGTYTIEELGMAPENIESWRETNRHRVSLKLVRKLTDECIEKMSIQDLNKKLRRFPRELKEKFRKRRRILKNRKYALKCRQKGEERANKIALENKALELDLLQAKEELRKIAMERDEYQLKYTQLKATIYALQGTGQISGDKNMLEDSI